MSTTNIMLVIIMLALHSTLWLSNSFIYAASDHSSLAVFIQKTMPGKSHTVLQKWLQETEEWLSKIPWEKRKIKCIQEILILRISMVD